MDYDPLSDCVPFLLNHGQSAISACFTQLLQIAISNAVMVNITFIHLADAFIQSDLQLLYKHVRGHTSGATRG